ncbi:MAG TPA: potassium channel protein [Desulfobulbus sp.]|nr:potassium channel protein [Desulfobulbus sp.]
MKSLPIFIYFLQNQRTRRNLIVLSKFLFFLIGIISLYSVLFHILMQYEGREYSWITGFYWSLTVMSTLGFGDITFHTDLGLFFTLIVLLSGVVFLLILLPFTLVHFFYAPWLDAQEKVRTPRELPEKISGHIILTHLEPITINLIKKLKKYHYPYALVIPDLNRAQKLHDQGYDVVVGELDDPETYRRLRINKAALVVTTNDDLTNTSIAFTIRELTDNVPIVTNAENEHSIDILEFPGNTHVVEFTKMLGQGLARRTSGVCMGTSVIGNFGRILIAEDPASGTPFKGKTLEETKIRKKTGLTVVGLWERGKFSDPSPQTVITPYMVLVLAGSKEQLQKYDALFNAACSPQLNNSPALILGGGRVGQAAAETLKNHHIKYTLIEKKPAVVMESQDNYILGDAADINTLRNAGIENAHTVLITTHNDAMNIYLTFYCRQLRPDIEIISRAIEERTVSKLYRAGADLVMSSASMASNSILNFLRPNELSMFTEGLNIFSCPVPKSLIGKALLKSRIKEQTGCTVIAINSSGEQKVGPDPATRFQKHDEIILIGTTEAEAGFLELYGGQMGRRRSGFKVS